MNYRTAEQCGNSLVLWGRQDFNLDDLFVFDGDFEKPKKIDKIYYEKRNMAWITKHDTIQSKSKC